jgi:hypothetical protein
MSTSPAFGRPHPLPPVLALQGRLPPFAVQALCGFLMPIAAGRAPDVIIGGEDNPYLRRWHITPRGNGPAVYLHHFMRSDDDRALHDHPWPSVSIILSGSYIEHEPGDVRMMRPPGTITTREPLSPHRVQLLPDPIHPDREQPVWTLFLTGDRVRDWGFHCPQGWVPWQDFTAGPDGTLVGKGCDQ